MVRTVHNVFLNASTMGTAFPRVPDRNDSCFQLRKFAFTTAQIDSQLHVLCRTTHWRSTRWLIIELRCRWSRRIVSRCTRNAKRRRQNGCWRASSTKSTSWARRSTPTRWQAAWRPKDDWWSRPIARHMPSPPPLPPLRRAARLHRVMTTTRQMTMILRWQSQS